MGGTRAYLREKGEDRIHACPGSVDVDIDFFSLNANDFLAESQFWGHFPLLSELHRSPPGLIISLTSPFLCSNYKGEKDDCKAIRVAIIFLKTFPTVLFPFHFLPSVLFLFLQSYVCFSLYFISSFLCCSFPHFPHPFPYVPHVSLHFGENFTNVCALKWEEPGMF